MNEYKKILGIFFLAIFLIPIIGLIQLVTGIGDEPKGELTIMDVGSSITEVKYNNKTVTLIGDEREEFLNILKKQRDDVDIGPDEDINYDILMDFKNDHTGKISIKDRIVVFNKHSFGMILTQKEIDKLLEIIKRNMK